MLIAALPVGSAWLLRLISPDSNVQFSCFSKEKINDQKIRDRYALFEDSVAENSVRLGKPTSCIEQVDRASEGIFQNAREIWTYKPHHFYLLYNFDNSWEMYPETIECGDRGENWCDDEQKRKEHFEGLFGRIPLNVKAKLHPPFGATGMFLDKNQDQFKKIGWQIWNCEMDSANRTIDPTFYQSFEHGVVLGVYRAGKQDASAVVFILLDVDGNKTYTIDPYRSEEHSGTACGPGSF